MADTAVDVTPEVSRQEAVDQAMKWAKNKADRARVLNLATHRLDPHDPSLTIEGVYPNRRFKDHDCGRHGCGAPATSVHAVGKAWLVFGCPAHSV